MVTIRLASFPQIWNHTTPARKKNTPRGGGWKSDRGGLSSKSLMAPRLIYPTHKLVHIFYIKNPGSISVRPPAVAGFPFQNKRASQKGRPLFKNPDLPLHIPYKFCSYQPFVFFHSNKFVLLGCNRCKLAYNYKLWASPSIYIFPVCHRCCASFPNGGLQGCSS